MSASPTSPAIGYLRLPEVLKIIPVSRSTWYRGIKAGIYPSPVKLGLRSSGWKVEAILGCIEKLENASATLQLIPFQFR